MIGRVDKSEGGFTVLELLISLSLFLIVLLAMAVALESSRGTYVRNESKIEVQQTARLALGEMAREIRMAGYFPENFASPPADPPVEIPVQVATDSALAIHGDVDASGASSVYLFCLDGSVLRRTKAPSGESSAYWCPAGEILAENVTGLRFDYFDDENDPIPGSPSGSYELDGQAPGSVPDLADTTERGAIRRVVVSMTVTREVPGGESQALTLASDVRLRNAG